MASSEVFFDLATQKHIITIQLNRIADATFIDSIHKAFEEAGKQFVAEHGEKILAAISTQNIEKYVAEYVTKNLELKLKEQTNEQ